jgi:glycolate dehydrogenase iron-sulfur subunit
MIREHIDDCVHCGFCLPTCPTYILWREEMDSPRGRIQLMEARLDGTIALDRTVVEHFDRCLGCMACVTSCPSGVAYDRLIETTRRTVEREFGRGVGERTLRGALFSVLPHRRRLGAALRLAPLGRIVPLPRRFRPLVELAPPWRSREQPPPFTPAVGVPRGRVALLVGCVQSVVFGDVNAATARVLAAEGWEVAVPAQGCCGALSAHAGRATEAERLTERLRHDLAGFDAIAVNAAGCASHLKDHGLPAVDVSELISGRPQTRRHPLPLRVAYQDSCHLRHAQALPTAYRPALSHIPGLEAVEPSEQDVCCGSAGIYNVLQPRAARELGDRKAQHVLGTRAQALASANPGCLVQLATALRRQGRRLPALHPIELVDASIRNVGTARLLRDARR